MKKIFILCILFLAISKLFGQSHGMSYQAILINEDEQEIPGVDIEGSYLPNQNLRIRFTIFDENDAMNFQEEHQTQTDQYGMINVTIGWGDITMDSPGSFMDIDWDGSPKNLRVEISLEESLDGFIEFSFEELTFVPYAYHRNITATGTMAIDGITDLNSDFTVNNASPAYLTGTLTVDDLTDLNADLNVNNASATSLSGTLTVEEETNLNNDLNVNNNNATNLSGELNVQGESTLQNVNLTTLNSESADMDFVATFANTNNDGGNGIKIKLGKAKVETGIPPDLNLEISQEEIDKMKKLIGNESGNTEKLQILKDLVIEGIESDIKMQAELAVGIGNFLIDFINEKLDIPEFTAFPGFSWTIPLTDKGFTIKPVTIDLDLPNIKAIDLNWIGIEGYDLESPDFWGIPSINLSNPSSNPLSKNNEFIQFSDMNESKIGAIRAQSIVDWGLNYLDPIFMWKLKGALTSTLDKKHARYHFTSKIYEALWSYTKIGVEYSSGNGDYAEWLERIDSTELIGAGDVIGVIGGKITKDLTSAEQIMAVSSNPIVLGNIPKTGKEYLGNNVAFMGQIPVKIMGPAKTGDYIVGKGKILGFGIAIDPLDMALEDFKHAVGRAWETNLNTGPKIINTVVGVHNGDYINVIKQYEERLNNQENRLKNIEEKLELLLESNS